MIYKLILF